HAFFQKYVWAYRTFLGLPSSLALVCPEERERQVTRIANSLHIDIKKKQNFDGLSSCLDFTCDSFISPQLDKKYHQHIRQFVAEIENLNKSGYLAFSDIAHYFHKLFLKTPNLLYRLRTKYPVLILDEYQDSSTLQDQIVRLILGTENKAIVMADEWQIIHGWRGASVDRIRDLKKDFLTVEKPLSEFRRYNKVLTSTFFQLRNVLKEVELNQKLYVPPEVVSRVADPVSKTFLKKMEKFKNPQERERRINSYIATTLPGMLTKNNKYDSAAILLLVNQDVQDYKRILRKKGLPIKELSNGDKLHNVLGLLLENIKDLDLQARRLFIVNVMNFLLLEEKIPGMASEKWTDLAKKIQQNPNKKICGQKPDIRVDLESIANVTNSISIILIDLVELVKERHKELLIDWDVYNVMDKIVRSLRRNPGLDLREVCTNLVLQEQHIISYKKPKGIYVMNVHQAKGREFDWVILPDVSESAFKSTEPEKRRLFYVALTRAKNKITFFDRPDMGNLAKVFK
ncbi:MAG: UvrD-helicase domain-containing protein, partial [Nitrosopumilaceae archaeon]|nr:ATP-dependent helicase [Nitrosopumilaceae archaeon]NIU02590.1 ATP-dependent helicase [Nitrosopumilaceae archaeon]NIU89052.1 UvrD-helicase domain-containing protein [Nitrosopumilaceae archaeon]NIV66736.1 UvrD-helicase domain-containing protein [Nitrosopumilaceae archaeon]NIX63191.1 UvrD-helicase domain-containing protein [Nitrosopumilaceae archaeon]